MKKLLMLIATIIAFATSAHSQIQVRQSTIQSEVIQRAANSGGIGYGGELSVIRMSALGDALYLLGVESTNEFDQRYILYLGASMEEALCTLRGLADLCDGNIGEQLTISTPPIPEGSTLKDSELLMENSIDITITGSGFRKDAYGRVTKGNSFIIQPHDTFAFAGILGVRKSALNYLVRRIEHPYPTVK